MKIKIYNYKFGNYANKAYRMFSSRAGWLAYMNSQVPLYQEGKAQNFNPGDGINTVISFSTITDSLVESANYVMVFNDDDTFHSSWFITTYQYMLGNGYALTLKRDLLSGYIYNVLGNYGLLKRGPIAPNRKTVFQFSPENISVNKIKQTEIPIRDQFGDTQWLLLYWTTNKMDGTEGNKVEAEIKTDPPVANINVSDITNWEYYNYIDTPLVLEGNYSKPFFRYNRKFRGSSYDGESNKIITEKWTVDPDPFLLGSSVSIPSGTLTSREAITDPSTQYRNDPILSVGATISDRIKHKSKDIFFPSTSKYRVALQGIINNFTVTSIPSEAAKAEAILSMNGMTIKDGTSGKYYRISAIQNTNILNDLESVVSTIRHNTTGPELTKWGDLGLYFKEEFQKTYDGYANDYWYAFNSGTGSWPVTASAEFIELGFNRSDATYVQFSLDELVPEGTTTFEMVSATKAGDEPFRILAIPVSDSVRCITPDGERMLNSSYAFHLASTLAAKYSGSAGGLYDVQLVPYAPSNELLSTLTGGKIDYTLYTGFKWIWNNSSIALPVFSIGTNNRQFQIELDNPITVSDYKLDRITKEVKLVSPSGKSVYDFSVAMNDGLEGFDIDMTFKPVNTMIHINPWFKWLYGSDFNDLRGLIISEDISMTQTSDAWENYKLQNLNYENSFNAQQEADRSRLNITDKYADKQNTLNTVNGIGSGLMKTVIAGVVGSPVAAIGAGISAAAGIATTNIQHANEKAQRSEMLTHDQDIAKRQFAMQMENIQALPQNLSKTSGFTILNKKHPFLELYDVSAEERTSIDIYFKFNGKNLNVMGNLSDYVNINEDFDYIEFAPYTSNIFSNMNINNELNTILSNGVYLCYEDKIPGMEE